MSLRGAVMIINGYEIKPGANLEGANLGGGNLRDADLRWANLESANLTGVIFISTTMGAHILSRYIGKRDRSDGYIFHAFETSAGPILIRAGCRTLTVEEYREHIAREYPNTAKAPETLAILEAFEVGATP